MSIVFGTMTNTFLDYHTSEINSTYIVMNMPHTDTTSTDTDVFQNRITQVCLQYTYIGIAVLITSYLQVVHSVTIVDCNIITSERYFQAYNLNRECTLKTLQIAAFEAACERQVYRLREQYYKAVLRQQIVWFDKRQSGEMASRLNECVFHRAVVGVNVSTVTWSVCVRVSATSSPCLYSSWRRSLPDSLWALFTIGN